MTKRRKPTTARFSAIERGRFTARAQSLGLTLSAYLRLLAARDCDDVREAAMLLPYCEAVGAGQGGERPRPAPHPKATRPVGGSVAELLRAHLKAHGGEA